MFDVFFLFVVFLFSVISCCFSCPILVDFCADGRSEKRLSALRLEQGRERSRLEAEEKALAAKKAELDKTAAELETRSALFFLSTVSSSRSSSSSSSSSSY